MKELSLSSNEDNYCVKGSIQELLNNKRAKMMLRSKFNYSTNADTIKFSSSQSIEQIVKIIKLVAEYIGAEVKYDKTTSGIIQEYAERESNFERFSLDAENIKNNHCNVEDFKKFVDILDDGMPCRHLYELQLLSAYHLAFSQNSCNFSVPGAGKTSIVYGAYTFLKNTQDESKKVDKLLIIGPLSSFGPWENEYEECFGEKVKCQRLSAKMSANQKKQYFYGNTAELTLMSYQSVMPLKDEIIYYLRNNRVMVVLDEAHKVKNTNGGISANAVMDLSRWCSSRVILTGTPAPNGYEDLYNLFHFIWPQFDVIKYNVGQLRDQNDE